MGYPPFSESPDLPPLTEQIQKGLYTFPESFWSGVSESAKDLIRQMMCIDPNKRLSMTSVLEHPWLATDHENTSQVDKLLCAPSNPIARSSKRPPEDSSMNCDDDTSTVDANSNGRTKRAKH